MSDLFGVVPLGQHGGKRPGAGRPRKGEVRPPKQRSKLNYGGSSSPVYIVARLKRDAADGCRDAAILLDGIYRNLISPFTAGAEMRYFQRPEPNGRGSENAARSRAWRLHRLFNPRPDPKAPTG
jgi:hypothetical protein